MTQSRIEVPIPQPEPEPHVQLAPTRVALATVFKTRWKPRSQLPLLPFEGSLAFCRLQTGYAIRKSQHR